MLNQKKQILGNPQRNAQAIQNFHFQTDYIRLLREFQQIFSVVSIDVIADKNFRSSIQLFCLSISRLELWITVSEYWSTKVRGSMAMKSAFKIFVSFSNVNSNCLICGKLREFEPWPIQSINMFSYFVTRWALLSTGNKADKIAHWIHEFHTCFAHLLQHALLRDSSVLEYANCPRAVDIGQHEL